MKKISPHFYLSLTHNSLSLLFFLSFFVFLFPPSLCACEMSDNAYTTKYDLQDLIQQYKTQPDLLKLILTSKVEEDKRRAEEAKLKAKELDLLLQQQSLKRKSSFQEESIEKRRHSAAAAMLAMGGGGAVIPNQQQQQSLVHSIIQPLSPIQQRSR